MAKRELLLAGAFAGWLLVSTAFAGGVQTAQVTGSVRAVTDDMIRWEIARGGVTAGPAATKR